VLITRLICAVYWLSLTTLLLVPDLKLLFGGRIPQVGTSVGVHFAAFALLAFFTLASRLPLRHVLLGVLLIGYAAATELLQKLFPPRTTELKDFVENLLGLAVGTAIWWGANRYVLRKPSGHE
jgi:VanZ family protein